MTLFNIISLHLEQCVRQCQHRSICYHINKYNINNKIDTNKIRLDYLNNPNNIVYESICNNITNNHIDLLKLYDNYHITTYWENAISIMDKIEHSIDLRNKLQISISHEWQIEYLESYEKLYLIKNQQTLNKFESWINNSDFNKIHFLIDQNFLFNDESILPTIIILWEKRKNMNVSLDSCLINWIINSSCIFAKNYIDITYDGTIRTCPYNKNYISTINKLDNGTFSQCDSSCYYYKKFNRG